MRYKSAAALEMAVKSAASASPMDTGRAVCFCQAIDEHSGMHELNTLAAMP